MEYCSTQEMKLVSLENSVFSVATNLEQNFYSDFFRERVYKNRKHVFSDKFTEE